MRGDEGAGAEHHGAGVEGEATAVVLDDDAGGTAVLDHDPAGRTAAEGGEVGAVEHLGWQIAEPGVAADSVDHVGGHRPEPGWCLIVLVGVVRESEGVGRVAERRGGRMVRAASPDTHRAPVAVQRAVTVVEVVLQRAQERQHSLVGPGRIARGGPAVEVLAAGTDEVAAVDGGRAAEDASAGHQPRPRRREAHGVCARGGVVRLRARDQEPVQQRRAETGRTARQGAGVHHEHVAVGVLGQPGRENRPRRSGAHHDDVVATPYRGSAAARGHGGRNCSMDTGSHVPLPSSLFLATAGTPTAARHRFCGRPQTGMAHVHAAGRRAGFRGADAKRVRRKYPSPVPSFWHRMSILSGAQGTAGGCDDPRSVPPSSTSFARARDQARTRRRVPAQFPSLSPPLTAAAVRPHPIR
ncbi:hypothetical protein SHIRM173S_06171 [Streptomyces hirsutus]